MSCTIDKAIDYVEEAALSLFIESNNYSCSYECEYEKCPEYERCKGKVEMLNDIAKHLRDLKKIKEVFVK